MRPSLLQPGPMRCVPARLGRCLPLLVAGALAACGTSTVNLVVVRPAVLNARVHGGTATVGAITPTQLDHALVSGQLRQEIALRIQNGFGATVRLMEMGGGLTILGRLDDYATTLRDGARPGVCTDTVKETKDGKTTDKKVERRCNWQWYEWTARVAMTVQITAANGQVLVLRPVLREASGRTHEVLGSQPPLPNLHATLQRLRLEVADEVAWLVVPHQERVNVKFYDCDEPATAVCESALRQLANADYDAAAATYTQALGLLENARAPAKERAEVLWNRGLVYKYGRRYDEARADLQRAEQLDPSMEYRVQLGEIERERDNHQTLLQQGLAPVGGPAAPQP